jgi:hypothetical protein
VRNRERQDRLVQAPRDSGDTEVALGDLMRFFLANWRFLLLAFLVSLAVLVPMALLLLPTQYSKQATLGITQTMNGIMAQLNAQPLPPDAAGTQAVSALATAGLEGVTVTPTYNPSTAQVQVAMESRSGETLSGAVPKLVRAADKGLQAAYVSVIGPAIDARLSVLDTELRVNRELLSQLEQRLSEGSGQARLGPQAVEEQRANLLVEIGKDEIEQRQLRDARDNLQSLAAEPATVQVVSETGIRNSSSVGRLIAAVAASAALAVAATVVRELLRRRRKAAHRRAAG